MKQYSSGLAAALTVTVAASPLQAQHFDEPSVMNQPYTQMVQDPYFGDYEGTYSAGEERPEPGSPKPVPAEAKVRALGNRAYAIVLRTHPADADEALQAEVAGRMEGERVIVSGSSQGHEWEGEIGKQALQIRKRGYGGVFQMKRVMKKSPVEALPPPPGAIVLLAFAPGKKPGLDPWTEAGWVATSEGIMHRNPGEGPRPDLPRRDLSTKREFKNVRLHLEFRIPYEPDLREQARGNSGVILADRYEVQVLDSYGLIPGDGDCASIYGVAPPRVNAAFPPLSWQTYDITFYAPRMEGGKMVRGPRLTVVWNGIKVHENQTASTPTGDAARPNAGSGPIRIQDHGNLVFYRNIWIEELPDTRD
jgi:hypothetical protein